MKKGKIVKIAGQKMYVPFDKKPVEERGVRTRSTVFHSKKEYKRSVYKKEALSW